MCAIIQKLRTKRRSISQPAGARSSIQADRPLKVDNSRPHTGKCLLSEAISRQKGNSSMPSRILEPLRNNSVCHKSVQSGSGATKSEVDRFPVYQTLAAVPACRLLPHFASVGCQWPDLVNAGRALPIDNVSQLPGV